MPSPTLGRGEFFGCRLAQREIGGFTLSMTQYDRGGELPWHAHHDTYVTFVVDGSYRERLRASARECTPRSVVVHPAGEEHANVFVTRFARCLNVQFDSLRGFGNRPAVVDTAAASAIGARMADEMRRADAFSALVIEGLLLELFAEIERAGDALRAPSWLRKVREVIASRYTEPLALADLAALVGVHPVHMARAFRRHYGRTVGELIRELRIERAKTRIASKMPLSEVALDAGFADQSHFVRTFRRATGVTPSAFRRMSPERS